MKKFLFISTLVSGFIFQGQAQQDLTGRVLDSARKPLSFATVVLLQPTDSVMKYFGVTNDKGVYQIKRVKSGEYLMQFSFTGLKTTYKTINVPLENPDLGDQRLFLDPKALDEVIVEAELIPIKFKTDTIEYNANAFKTREGAAVEELLEQLPGVEVDREGNVKAQGEDVVKVLVDGKEFFGNDPKVATKNLPAKAIDKIQVLDRKTDQAVFTGIEDGERERTINLLLKADHKNGYFGEIKAGAGTNSSYTGEAKIYRFSDKIQAAVLGLQNNINQFGFTYKGNDTFGQNSKGINESFAAGLNLSLNKANGNRYFASFLGNNRKKNLLETASTQNFLETGDYNQTSTLVESERDRPNDIDFGVRHKIGDKQLIVIDGDITLGSNRTNSQTNSNANLGNMDLNTFINNTLNVADEFALVSNNSYSLKIKGDDLQFGLKFGINYTDNENALDWTNITSLFQPEITNTVHQLRTDRVDRLNATVIPTLTKKINNYWSTDLGVSISSNKRNLNREEGTFNDQNELIGIDIPDFSTLETTVKPTITLRRATTKSVVNFSLGASGTRFEKSLSNTIGESPEYLFFTPRLIYRNQYRSGRRIEFRYNTSANLPSPNQLFPIENNQNQVNLYQGNFDLRPEFNHNASFLWSVFDEFSFTSFFIRAMGNYTNHKINNVVTVNDQLIQTTTPVNTSGQTMLAFNAEFSAPIRSLGLNYSVSVLENWTNGITLVNGQENETKTFNHGLTMSFENRSKEKVRINFGGTINYTQYDFSIADIPDDNFFNISYFSTLRYTPTRRWNFTANANVTNFNAQSFDESVTIPLISASVSYGFLQAEKATVSINTFDLLNKYRGFQRISTGNFLSQTEWNTIGQYFMLTLAYRFR
ncbi:outer membrane beta-barrel protein [Roseivirga sp.]|uniref:outer membrane beta-barrel protein n=1 Tax=Roseivirga sp. TaxID=1964215 RepID=UPI003B8D3A82